MTTENKVNSISGALPTVNSDSKFADDPVERNWEWLDEWLYSPEQIKRLRISLGEMREGRILPWQIALMPLPRPVFWVLFNWIAPWTWGRKYRRAIKTDGSDG